MGTTFSNEEYEEERRVKNIAIELHQPINLANLSPHYKKMCDECEIFEYLESEYRLERRSQLSRLREIRDPFDMDDRDFIREYRLSKDMFTTLCDDLEPLMKTNPIRSSDLNLETKVLTAIYIYAHGSYQRPTGRAQHVAQQTVSTVLAEVTAAINNIEIRNKYIKFPQTAAKRDANKLRFYEKFGIPGTIGCIDGTHVALVRPYENEERYFCRKNYHSLNMQLICNADMQIISVDASHPGANHDSFIWSHHPLRPHLENLSSSEALWLLGDSGYPLRKTMMTPILNAQADSPEAYFTEKHVKCRNIIERTIGVLKARFRCLLVHRVLNYQPDVAGCIANACVILHNICNAANLAVPELSEDEVQREAFMQPSAIPHVNTAGRQNRELQIGIATRQDLVERLWLLRQA